MSIRNIFAVLALLGLPALVFASAPVEKVRNAKVRTVEVTLQPGESVAPATGHPGVVVYFEAGTVATNARGANVNSVRAGEVGYLSRGADRVVNRGGAPLHLVLVDYVGDGSSETWGKTGLAPHYTLLHEDRFGRVYDIKIPAGTSEPQHTHHDRIVVALSGAVLRHEMPDGRTEKSTLQTGEILWRRGGTHVGHNLGQTDLWVIAIEPK